MRSRPRVAAGGVGGAHGGRAVEVLGVRSGDGVQEQRRVGDRTGEGAVHGEPLEGVAVRVDRDASALRFDADEVRPRGGDAHGSGAVRAEGGGDEPGGDGRRRSAGGAARGVRGVPGVAGGPEGGAFGEGPLAQFAGVGLADDDGSGGAQPADRLAVGGGRGQRAVAAEVGGQARHIGVVLDRDRHAEERQPLPRREPPVGLGGLGEGRFGPQVAEGVEGGLGGLDAGEGVGHERGRGGGGVGEPAGALRESGHRRGNGGGGAGGPIGIPYGRAGLLGGLR